MPEKREEVTTEGGLNKSPKKFESSQRGIIEAYLQKEGKKRLSPINRTPTIPKISKIALKFLGLN